MTTTHAALQKKRRRACFFALLFLIWVVVGAGMFLYMWENRNAYVSDDPFRQPPEDNEK